MQKNVFRLPIDIIDSHVHGRDGDEKHKTTILQVMTEALQNLINIMAFMPNTKPAIDSIPTLLQFLTLMKQAKLALGSLARYYVWFGATDFNLKECEKALRLSEVLGIKIYPLLSARQATTTGTIGVTSDITIKSTIRMTALANKAVSVHCDDPAFLEIFKNSKLAEQAYVRKIIEVTRKIPNAKVVICHVSCVESAQAILDAQKEGLNIAMEIMPHYLIFDCIGTNWRPGLDKVFYHCFNNLRGSDDRLFLTNLLTTDNPLIWIASDSACHTTEEKLKLGLAGIPSNQEMVSAALKIALENNISEKRAADLLCFNQSAFLNIPVSRETRPYRITFKPDEKVYNNGAVTNPWQGLILPQLTPLTEKEKG